MEFLKLIIVALIQVPSPDTQAYLQGGALRVDVCFPAATGHQFGSINGYPHFLSRISRLTYACMITLGVCFAVLRRHAQQLLS